MTAFSKLFQRVALPFVATVLVAFSGCEKPRPEGMPKLTKCAVTITTDDGKPFVDATVVLYPADENAAATSKWSSAGKTDASGKAVIVTHGQYPGAPAGDYKVVVQKQLIEGEVNTEDGTGVQTEPIEYYSLVALDYTQPETTPLTLKIGDSAASETFKIGNEEKILTDKVIPGQGGM